MARSFAATTFAQPPPHGWSGLTATAGGGAAAAPAGTTPADAWWLSDASAAAPAGVTAAAAAAAAAAPAVAPAGVTAAAAAAASAAALRAAEVARDAAVAKYNTIQTKIREMDELMLNASTAEVREPLQRACDEYVRLLNLATEELDAAEAVVAVELSKRN